MREVSIRAEILGQTDQIVLMRICASMQLLKRSERISSVLTVPELRTTPTSWDVLIYMAPGWQGVTRVDSCTLSKRAKQARFYILPPATNEIREHMSKTNAETCFLVI